MSNSRDKSLNDVSWTRNEALCLPLYGAASLGVLVLTFGFIFRAKQLYGKAWRVIWLRVMTAFFRCHHPQLNNTTSLPHGSCSCNAWLWRLKPYRSSETSNTTHLKQLRIPEELSPQKHRYQNLRYSSACPSLGYCPRICLEKLSQNINVDQMAFRSTECPTRYRIRHFFNNANTNEDIPTKFEQKYVRCVRNEEECVCSVCQISFQYPH